MRIDLKANEVVIKASDTLHSSGSDITRGKLILTNQRLYFKPVVKEAENGGFELMPHEIRDILLYNILAFIPAGIELVTGDGLKLRFRLKNRNEWSRQIALLC
ncbi:MAG: hypothetical protein JNL22_05555 [Bacteroidales bacterium]|jgi:hypothetical protein|nr:hypothetical protein [Bacteroidales bacterium]